MGVVVVRVLLTMLPNAIQVAALDDAMVVVIEG